jgi:DNA polymerase-3 subunit delta'
VPAKRATTSKKSKAAPAADAPGLVEAAAAAAPKPPIATGFDQVFGHRRAKEILSSAMASGRVHHAWVFHGPAGVGKFTLARALAAQLLDPTLTIARTASGIALTTDPASPTRGLVLAGSHPDLGVITKELAAVSRDDQVRRSKQRTIPVEVVREFLTEPAARSRAASGGAPDGRKSLATRVFIVDEAELLNDAGQNTLLKTLEEPPPGVVMILVTSSPDRLLATIRSRSQKVGFGPLSPQELDAWYVRAAMPSAPDQRAWLVRMSGGSPGWISEAVVHAVHSMEPDLSPALEALAGGKFPAGLGSTLARIVEERAQAHVKANPEASKEAANVTWARAVLGILAEDQRGRLRNATDERERETALHRLDAIGEAEAQVRLNVQVGFALENLVVQMAG